MKRLGGMPSAKEIECRDGTNRTRADHGFYGTRIAAQIRPLKHYAISDFLHVRTKIDIRKSSSMFISLNGLAKISGK